MHRQLLQRGKMKLLAFLCVLGTLCTLGSCGPIHASCRLTWQIPRTCTESQTAIANQMTIWATNKTCPNGNGEKCLYKISTNTPGTLKGTHTTPVKHYVDDLTMTFAVGESSTCTVSSYSTSETWYAVLDYGTNYCNLHNLVDGAGLTGDKGFKEEANDSTCTQYSQHNCTKY